MAPPSQYHAYSLPPDLLLTSTPRNLVNLNTTPTRPPTPELSNPNALRTCNICLAASFLDVEEQRRHFRSDWHRYNIRMRLKGENIVNETAFSHLIEGVLLLHLFAYYFILICFSSG